MKKSIKVISILLLLVIVIWRCSTPHSASVTANSYLPQDVKQSCTITQDSFAHWFVDKKVSLNGAVTHANSVTFPHNNNCDFYNWSEHMFLWLTSPSPGGGSVMESSLFYNVSPIVNGVRNLIPHTPGTPLQMINHLDKEGPNHLPVVKDSTGRLLEIENAEPAVHMTALVKSDNAASTEVAKVSEEPGGKLHFMDRSGKELAHPKALIRHQHPENFVQRFKVGNHYVFLDSKGRVIEAESAQATDDVLLSKQGAMVYYLTLVNDVYAYYMTGTKTNALVNGHFPTTAGARDSICAYARKSGATLPDSNALAMEIKSAWVEASTLPDAKNYFQVKATITTYNTSNPHQWVPNGQKTVMMAMVGIHIVGSVAHHPEMIWATFEHQGVTPAAAYPYLNTKGDTITHPADSGNNWVFNSNSASDSVNISHATVYNQQTGKTTDTILSDNGHTISASNTRRIFAFGSTGVANPEDGSEAAANSEIISMNNNVRGYLAQGDIRANYVLIGATWTNGGAAPDGNSYSDSTKENGAAIGSNVLANSTMETYFQSPTQSCFTCHSNGGILPQDLSHVYVRLVPQIPKSAAKKK